MDGPEASQCDPSVVLGSKIAISIEASRLGLGGLGLGGHMNWAAAINFASLKRETILKVQS